jgi:plastocyanin
MTEETTTQPESGDNRVNLLTVIGILAVIGIIAFVMAQNTGEPPSKEVTPAEEIEVMDGEVMQEEALMESEATKGAIDEEEVMQATEDEVVLIEMEAGDFSFDPDEIIVNLGDTVRIGMKAADLMHDFVIDELNVQSAVIAAGETTTIEFVADQIGEFEYYCSIGSHRAQGMFGTLIVEE